MKQFWIDSAHKWLADPTADSGLLHTASQAVKLADPALSQQCLQECRERRKRQK
jgi:hypothetical protein